MKKEKCVLILSGGADSTTLLYHLLAQGYEVYALSFDYGQKHKRELDCAQQTCFKLDVPIAFAKIPPILGGSALTDDKIRVPQGKYAKENIEVTVVPHRNLIMLSIAAGYAESIKAKYLFYGAHRNDSASYWDTRPKFYKKVNEILILNDIFPVELNAPFLRMSKADIVSLGKDLGVDYSLTWSCYVGGNKACGKCSTCLERIAAFANADLRDPIEYEAPIKD